MASSPPTPPDHSAGSFSDRLCEKCRKIPWDPPGVEDVDPEIHVDWDFDHHETFAQLEQSCERKCPLCQMLWTILAYDDQTLSQNDPMNWSFEKGPASRRVMFKSSKWWYMEEDGIIKPNQYVPQVRRLAPSTLENDLETLLSQSIHPWLRACMESGKHHDCISLESYKSRSTPLPTRLIDVGTERGHTLRLVETEKHVRKNDAKPPYLILSYRWGKENDNINAKTTKDNLEERKENMVMEELPKTIQDAVIITRQMEVRYLWVDAVCIVQSTPGTVNNDWSVESMKMADYYSNAYCCIAASSAEDSSEGILVERQVARFPFSEFYTPSGVSLQSPHALRRSFRNPLLDRGWCLQEWLLSPRILHWTRNGLVWQCREGYFWEGQLGFQGEPREALEDWESSLDIRYTNDCVFSVGRSWPSDSATISRILSSKKTEALGIGWDNLVVAYSRTALTQPKDRLAAIHGIASYLSDRHEVGYFAGIFESACVDSLLWAIDDGDDRKDQDSEANTDFPSWSWASAMAPIYFPYVPYGRLQESKSLMQCLSPFPSANEVRDLRTRSNREIRINAPLVQLHVVAQERQDHHFFEFCPSSPIWRGKQCSIRLDWLTPKSLSLQNALLLLLREWSSRTRRYCDGLVVQKCSQDGDVITYQRIGRFSLRGYLREDLDLSCLREWRTEVILVCSIYVRQMSFATYLSLDSTASGLVPEVNGGAILNGLMMWLNVGFRHF